MKSSVGDITKSGHNKICEAPRLGRLESLMGVCDRGAT